MAWVSLLFNESKDAGCEADFDKVLAEFRLIISAPPTMQFVGNRMFHNHSHNYRVTLFICKCNKSPKGSKLVEMLQIRWNVTN